MLFKSFYSFSDLPTWLSHNWEWCVEVLKGFYLIIYFSFQFCQIFLKYFVALLSTYMFIIVLYSWWASLIAQLKNNPPAMQETLVQFLDWEDPLEKG